MSTSTNASALSAYARVEREHERFRTRYLQVAAGMMTAFALALVGPTYIGDPTSPLLPSSIGGAGLFIGVIFLVRHGRFELGANLFLYGLLAAALGATHGRLTEYGFITLAVVAMLAVGIAAFIRERTPLLVYAAVWLAALLFTTVATHQTKLVLERDFWALTVIVIMVPLTLTATLVLFVDHFRNTLAAHRANALDIERVMEQAKRIAQGDLSGEIEGEGEVPEVVRAMLGGLRQIVTEIRRTVASLGASATEIAAMARQQETGSLEQASAVQEIQQTLSALAAASAEVEDHSREVAVAAGQTEATHAVISGHIGELTGHTRRIGELLEVIKDIANKSEVLALNASLEGAKAGDAGRGFSLVAGQMQRLAESVMESVASVKAITTDVRESTNTTVVSTEQGAKIATATARAAQQITKLTEKQRAGTEQVTAAMDDISDVARQVSAGTTQTLAATKDLSRLSDELSRVVAGFQLPAGADVSA